MALISLLIVLVNAETMPQCHSELVPVPGTAKNLGLDYYLQGNPVVQLNGSARTDKVNPIRVYPRRSAPLVPPLRPEANPCLSVCSIKYDSTITTTYVYRSKKRESDPWFSEDKFWHFALSLTLTGSSYHFIRCRLDEPETRAAVYSLGFSFGCGLGKELYDSKKPRSYFSYKDLIYDLLGIGAGYLLFIHTYH